ncbi:CRIB domain-containing protein RIC8 [Brassica rapa]|uniref:CRIB domain-containing protein RIC8 n=1 Tax=Brassica campestris TaxID=3711 RepID=UPI00142D2204|nr:CRIB domain-containing protein RIC8 [Brassica rapa]XP_048599355.1 CRIB domain-containing protein RIC8 isoform X1 [Brassica napus]
MYLCNILFEMISILSFVKLQNAENEKEPEMQIGTPTDVKHVAHIGWDGGSPNQNSPSWMNDFNASGGYSSSPLGNIKEDGSCISEDSTRSRDIPRYPKSSRDRSNNLESPAKERTRRGSSNSSGNPKTSRRSKESSSISQDGSVRSRRKKSKDSVNGGSTRSSRRARDSQTESISGSMSDGESLISLSFEDL